MKHIKLLILLHICIPYQIQAQNQTVLTGMVWVQGGKATIGSDKGADDEKPAFETSITGYWLDQNPVTVTDFKKFVRFTQYRTTAEKKGYGICYDSTQKEWRKLKGAYWLYPAGKNKGIAAPDSPVRQISWQDAHAYANWIEKRLPTELEWEYALQNKAALALAYTHQDLWQWCENWYFAYNETGYYSGKLNRAKSLRAGKKEAEIRPSLRYAAFPDEFAFNMGFRCAKDK